MISQLSGPKNQKSPEPGLATDTTWAVPSAVPGAPVRNRAVIPKRPRRQRAVEVLEPQVEPGGKVEPVTPEPWIEPLWAPSASEAPPDQTATRPACGVVSGTLIVARIWLCVRATFHSRSSSIEPCGVCCQSTSLPIRTSLVLMGSGPVSAKTEISSPLM